MWVQPQTALRHALGLPSAAEGGGGGHDLWLGPRAESKVQKRQSSPCSGEKKVGFILTFSSLSRGQKGTLQRFRPAAGMWWVLASNPKAGSR